MITTNKIKYNEWQVLIDGEDAGTLKKYISTTSGMVKNRTTLEWWPSFDEDEIVYLDAKKVNDAKVEISGYYS